MPKKKGAAQKKPAGEGTRSVMFTMRISPEEQEAMSRCAAELGLGLGPWLRMLGMREVQKAEK